MVYTTIFHVYTTITQWCTQPFPNDVHNHLPPTSQTKNSTFAHQVLCKVSGQHIRRQPSQHALWSNGQRRNYPRCNGHTVTHRIHRIEHQWPRFLKVFVVCCGGALEHTHDASQVALQTPRLASDQLQCIRVLFLWHEAASCGIRIAALHKTKLPRAVYDEVLSKPGQVDQVHGGKVNGVCYIVTVTHCVHAVGAYPTYLCMGAWGGVGFGVVKLSWLCIGHVNTTVMFPYVHHNSYTTRSVHTCSVHTPHHLHTTHTMPSSFAKNCLSTQNGLPAKAPLPSGSVATRGIVSLRRMSSRCHDDT